MNRLFIFTFVFFCGFFLNPLFWTHIYLSYNFASFCIDFSMLGRLFMFPKLGEVVLCRCCMGSRITTLLLPDLYILEVSPLWAVYLFCCGSTDYWGVLVGRADHWPSCLRDPAFYNHSMTTEMGVFFLHYWLLCLGGRDYSWPPCMWSYVPL